MHKAHNENSYTSMSQKVFLTSWCCTSWCIKKIRLYYILVQFSLQKWCTEYLILPFTEPRVSGIPDSWMPGTPSRTCVLARSSTTISSSGVTVGLLPPPVGGRRCSECFFTAENIFRESLFEYIIYKNLKWYI